MPDAPQSREAASANQPAMFDAYAPPEMARRVETVGVAKAAMPLLPLVALSFLAGAFISLGAMLFTVTVTESGLGLGPQRLLGGLAFSLGLILVVVGGAELFTGNSLIVMAWAHRKVTTSALLRNWLIVYMGNLVGALGMVGLAWWSGMLHMGGDAVARTAFGIAAGKVALDLDVAFVRGILCNVLVCLAVWLCFSARNVSSKILCIVFPIAGFVAMGFEHSIANMYFVPLAILAAADPAYGEALAAVGNPAGLDISGFLANLIPVTIGNIVGGGLFVALTYYVIYLRGKEG